MKGVYKITSPSGSIYIGQSIDIERRWANHRNPKYNENCAVLAKSFKKYGVGNHVFEIMHELPCDTTAEVLNNYETFCIQQYKQAGVRLLNVKTTANNHNEETRRKISSGLKGIKRSKEQIENHIKFLKGNTYNKGTKYSDEAIAKIKAARAKQKNVKGPPKGNIPWNKGIKTGISWNKGVSPSEETRQKISNTLKGNKLSPNSIAKRTETRRKNGWNKRSQHS